MRQMGKKKLWKRRARPGGAAPERIPGTHAGRPPQDPGDFSRNWKALRELLKQKSQAREKPVSASPVESKMLPQVTQPNRTPVSAAAKPEEPAREGPRHEARRGATPGRPPGRRKGPAVPEVKGSKRKAHGDPALRTVDGGPRKRRAPAAPQPPTEDDLWFDDVDPADIEAALGPEAARIARSRLGLREPCVTLEKDQAFSGLTRALALDCEMVGVGPGGEESVAARVSVVNQFGKCVYDKYVKPTQPVTDYRTAVSGIRPQHLGHGEDLEVVQREVANMLKGRVLVGHALHNDLKVLFLDHPKRRIRDTQKYKPFKTQVKSGRPSLKLLAEKILGVQVQQAEHCSVQDAQVAMRLYVTVKKEWEASAQRRCPATSTCPGADAS
ncbi:RNA exonuclease 4 [Sorex fumeus]|uniref:RNA exonuclease 4 n=1 Tax=Sorex fumeus TaxID=62283 RepID=UPI0024ADCA98|nr:RNA exonuclease 4 [Sorex fumeus]